MVLGYFISGFLVSANFAAPFLLFEWTAASSIIIQQLLFEVGNP